MTAKLVIEVEYNLTAGVCEGRINGGSRFYFSGHAGAPMPRSITNAIEGLRRGTTLATCKPAEALADALSADEIFTRIREYEQRGGTIQRAGVAKREYTTLSLEDLDID